MTLRQKTKLRDDSLECCAASSCLHNVKSHLLTFSLSVPPPSRRVINICVRRCWKLFLDANIRGNNVFWTILSEAQRWLCETIPAVWEQPDSNSPKPPFLPCIHPVRILTLTLSLSKSSTWLDALSSFNLTGWMLTLCANVSSWTPLQTKWMIINCRRQYWLQSYLRNSVD